MANAQQLAVLKQGVNGWNTWRRANPTVRIDLNGANLNGADLNDADLNDAHLNSAYLNRAYLRHANLSFADLRHAHLIGTRLGNADLSLADLTHADLNGAHLRHADLSFADLRGANLKHADLSFADLRGADLRHAHLSHADLSFADLRGAYLDDADLRHVDLRGTKQGSYHPTHTSSQPETNRSSPSSSLRLVDTYGNTLLVTAATLPSVLQGLDVVERHWKEHQEKTLHQGTASPDKTSPSDKEITSILFAMDDGNHHSFQRWVSDPDTLRQYINAFNDPTSKVKPLHVTFKKEKGRALSIDITEGGTDNPQLNIILDYLEADPQ